MNNRTGNGNLLVEDWKPPLTLTFIATVIWVGGLIFAVFKVSEDYTPKEQVIAVLGPFVMGFLALLLPCLATLRPNKFIWLNHPSVLTMVQAVMVILNAGLGVYFKLKNLRDFVSMSESLVGFFVSIQATPSEINLGVSPFILGVMVGMVPAIQEPESPETKLIVLAVTTRVVVVLIFLAHLYNRCFVVQGAGNGGENNGGNISGPENGG